MPDRSASRHPSGYGLVQVTVGDAGADPLPTMPYVTDVLAGTCRFHEALRHTASVPLCRYTPFQTWMRLLALPGVKLVVQPDTAVVPAVTVTSPWKPPGQL